MPVDMWTQLEAEVLDRLLHGERRPLADPQADARPGIYAIFFSIGEVPDSCLDHPGLRDGGWPCYVGVSDSSVAARLAEHRNGLRPVRNLTTEMLDVITLSLPNAGAARMAEWTALDRFKPVYCSVLRGFGSKPQGANRADQARSPFSVLHPGRPGPCGPPKLKRPALRVQVRQHLDSTVPLTPTWLPKA